MGVVSLEKCYDPPTEDTPSFALTTNKYMYVFFSGNCDQKPRPIAWF